MKQNMDALLNLSAFGIFNHADAGATVHCTYDPATKKYKMEYIYYLIDFYDFECYDYFYKLDALGLAQSYELYGMTTGITSWKKVIHLFVLLISLSGGVLFEKKRNWSGTVFLILVILCFVWVMWYVFGRDFIPWTRTYFYSYDNFKKMLNLLYSPKHCQNRLIMWNIIGIMVGGISCAV